MRKLLCLMLSLMAATWVSAADFEVGYFAYTTLSDGTLACTGLSSTYSGTGTTLVIPGYVQCPDDQRYYQVKQINADAFKSNTTLKTVRLQYGIEEIGSNAFMGCSSLNTVYLPSSIKTINLYAFLNAPLNSIYCAAEVMPSNLSIAGISSSGNTPKWYEPTDAGVTAANANSAITQSFTVEKSHKASDINTNMVVNGQVTTFFGNITSPVPNIQSTSSRGKCKVMAIVPSSVNNPDGIVQATQNYIKDGLYRYSITEIAQQACQANVDITSLDLTALTVLETIGNYSFSNMSSLTSITLPDNLKTMGTACLAACPQLESLTIPKGVTSIQYTNFVQGCTSLGSITVAEENSTYASHNEILFNKAKTTLLKCPEAHKGNGYIGSIYIYQVPATVTTIAPYAFKDNTQIKELHSISIKTIQSYAFENCAFSMVQLPSSLRSISNYAFKGCTSIRSLYINTQTPPTITTGNHFAGCDVSKITLNVPYFMNETYEQKGWTGFKDVNNPAFDLSLVTYDNNGNMSQRLWLTITSTAPETIEGTQFDGRAQVSRLYITTPYYENDPTETDGQIYRGVQGYGKAFAITSIGSHALQTSNLNFYNIRGCALIDSVGSNVCANPYMRSIELPYASYIGKQAFKGAVSNFVYWGRRLRTIDNEAFRGTWLYDATLPYGVKTIGDYAFADKNDARTTMVIPSSVTSIGPNFLKGALLSYLYINNERWADSDVSFDFTGVPDTCFVLTPRQKQDLFRQHPSWQHFELIYSGAFDFYDATTQTQYTVIDPEQATAQLVYPNGYRSFTSFYTKLDLASTRPTDTKFGGEYTLTELGPECLFQAANLDTLLLPETVTMIGESAMYGTEALKMLQCDAVTPPALGADVWIGVDQRKVTLIVPPESEELYRAADQWKGFFVEVLLGDLNHNGVVDIDDVNRCIRLILWGVYNTDADINSDGKVDIDDVARIISIILNKQ